MIKSFKHRGLKRLYERGDRRRSTPNYVGKVELILADLDASETLGHMRPFRGRFFAGTAQGRHSRESGHPVIPHTTGQTAWMPACAGMTAQIAWAREESAGKPHQYWAERKTYPYELVSVRCLPPWLSFLQGLAITPLLRACQFRSTPNPAGKWGRTWQAGEYTGKASLKM